MYICLNIYTSWKPISLLLSYEKGNDRMTLKPGFSRFTSIYKGVFFMKTMTITIDKCNMDIVKDKFAKVLKKAEKFPEKKFFTFKFINEQIVLGDVVADDLIDVVIEYDVLKYNDWYFIGKINADSEHSRNVIHRTKTMEDIDIPDYYYTCSANHCDHCNIDRYRKDTYIIYNNVTKEYKQVGSSCLKDFLGYDISGMFSMYDVFNDVIDEIEDYDINDPRYRSTLEYEKFNIFFMLSRIIYEIDTNGYVSVKQAESEFGKISTKAQIQSMLIDYHNSNNVKNIFNPKMELNTMDRAKDIVSYFKNEISNNPNNYRMDYWKTIDTILTDEFVTFNEIGYIAALPMIYFNNMKKKDTSDYVGNIGDKVKGMELTYFNKCSFETIYGVMTIYMFKDINNNILVWKTSTYIDIELNKVYRMSFTIKEHSEYKGIKQTNIIRAKII